MNWIKSSAISRMMTNLKTPVRALDLRAGVAMVLAGLMCDGVTQVENIKYIERGYENIVDKLASLGADIYLEKGPERALYQVG